MRFSAARIKRQVARLLNETATVKRVTRTDLGNGKWREDPTTIATAAKCRIAPLTSSQIEIAMRRYGEVTHAGIFDPDQELAPEYLVTDSRGREFTVMSPPIEPSISDIYRKVLMYERVAAP